MKRKLTALLLTAVLLLGTLALPASAAELPFTDVPSDAWYKDAVKYAYENNLFSGTGAATFSPNAPMTRGMFVQVLASKTGNYDKADWAGKSSFSDVNKEKWYAAPVEWASKAGIVSGMSEDSFAPEKNVSREQMAVILYNYAKKTGNDITFDSGALSSFSDASSVSGWAKEAMQWAVTHKIINGSDGKLNPAGNAKRCEVAQVTKNADPILVKNEVEIADAPDIPDDPNKDLRKTGIETYADFCRVWVPRSGIGTHNKKRVYCNCEPASNITKSDILLILQNTSEDTFEKCAFQYLEEKFPYYEEAVSISLSFGYFSYTHPEESELFLQIYKDPETDGKIIVRK